MPDASVLIVDDEEMVRTALEQWLRLSGFETHVATDARAALERLDEIRPHVILSDVRMPGLSGLDLLRKVRERMLPTEVILITGHGDVPMAVEAMRQGAFDFLQKPYVPDDLVSILRRAVEQVSLRREVADLRRRLDGGEAELQTRLVGNSPAMENLRRLVRDLATIPTDVIILGETGTGKEVVARCLHDFSPRAKGPFVAVNCAAIPSELIESELFGHEAGAFTGAGAQRIGKFEYASGGTLLLDEIESMPLLAQAKVLRVIQERVVERVGSNRQIPLDLRIVAASKVDLAAESEAGRFRADLYYRLEPCDHFAGAAARTRRGLHPAVPPFPGGSGQALRPAGAATPSRRSRCAGAPWLAGQCAGTEGGCGPLRHRPRRHRSISCGHSRPRCARRSGGDGRARRAGCRL